LSAGMSLSCVIEIEYPTREEAEKVARSISLDNVGYVDTEVVGSVLRLSAEAGSAPSMLHTVEDLMACLKVADQIVRESDGSEDALSDLDG